MFNFEFYQAPITAETLVAMIFAVIIFIVVPVILAVVEYRTTKKNRKHGLYIMIGTFASALLLGWYSLLVGRLSVCMDHFGLAGTLFSQSTISTILEHSICIIWSIFRGIVRHPIFYNRDLERRPLQRFYRRILLVDCRHSL